jgi:hypothetical protein
MNFVLVWMLMSITLKGGVAYSPATDLESCQRAQAVAVEADNKGFYVYSKCIQIRVDPRMVKQP